MESQIQRRGWLSILLIVFVAVAGCTGNPKAAPTLATPPATETPSPKPTIAHTATPDEVATADFIETASISTIVATVQPYVLAQYPSLDGRWLVEGVRYECTRYDPFQEKVAYEQLKLINLSDRSVKIVADQRQNCGGLGAFGFNGLYWSPSNRYFYFNESREGVPDGGCGNYIPLPIYRLDTVTQEVIMLNGGFISPDKTKLAMWQGHDIVIWDLDKEVIARVMPLKPGLLDGRMWWSAKSDSILYLQTEFECAPSFGKTYLVNLDLTNLSQTLITQYELTNTGWVSTPAPAGVFVFYFYSPLIMNYDPSIWEIKNGLQAKKLASCSIAEQGPTDFNGPHTSKVVQLGNVKYEVLSSPDASRDIVSRAYIADQSLATEAGPPVFWVSAKPAEWNKCRSLAEKVLSTLHFPP